MHLYSLYGTGWVLFGAERIEAERVRFTVWFSVFFVPVFPRTSYTAIYQGIGTGDSYGEYFIMKDVQTVPHDAMRLVSTFVVGWVAALLAVAPFAYMILRVGSRPASNIEVGFVFSSLAWIVVVLIFCRRNGQKVLAGR